MLKHISLFLFLSFCIANLSAQITTSEMSGKMTSVDGAVIGAYVKAVHEPSNTEYATATNNEGRFFLSGMRPGGPYKVTISSLGYETEVLTNIYLQLGATQHIDVRMKESAIALTEVNIRGNNSKFSSEKTGISTNIDQTQLTTLPSVSRSLTDFARLSPYFNSGMSFIGSDGRMSAFTIDGANLNNNLGLTSDFPGGGNPISLDAIEEMQVAIAPFDVRQSNFVGGAINAITKSGTNQFRGTAYTYFTNENMRGNRIDGSSLGVKEKEATTTYGVSLGGPIIKNKLFFFVNGEYTNYPYQITKFRPRGGGRCPAIQ